VTFFETQTCPLQDGPELRDPDLNVPLATQVFLQLHQCSIRLIFHPRSQIFNRFGGDAALAATLASRWLLLLSRPAEKS